MRRKPSRLQSDWPALVDPAAGMLLVKHMTACSLAGRFTSATREGNQGGHGAEELWNRCGCWRGRNYTRVGTGSDRGRSAAVVRAVCRRVAWPPKVRKESGLFPGRAGVDGW